MKYVIIAASLILSSVAAQAGEIKLVNHDGSSLSQLCVAAATSDKPAQSLVLELGLAPLTVNEVACNGQPLPSFVNHYRAPSEAASQVEANYVVSAANQSPETRLCLAALTSDAEFEKIKAAHFSDVLDVEQSVSCNKLPLGRFVRKYRSHVTAQLPQITAAF
ncbi:MAG TPA: hypothetical protein VMH83_11210 [Candidatus Acidoferrum sp.]|nr:hypothetical protein [Candidatus Acidoferrum sp.]